MTKTLNKEQIKAIRIVKGFTSDLRVKLTGVNEESIWYFIDENRFGLLGTEFGMSKSTHSVSVEWDEYERTLNKMVNQVVEGR